jgi:hypothetical protein
MLGFGMVYALILGAACGGAEAMAGTEEFTFALPATRSERFRARLALGGGALAVMQIVGLVAIACDMPQMLWGLAVDSGFTEPFPQVASRYVYWLAAALPFATFATIFALAAGGNGGSAMTRLAWLSGLIVAGMTAGLGFIAESALWGHLNGYVSCSALLVLTVLALLIGHRVYVRKEGISRPDPAAGGSHGWLWSLMILALLALLLLMMIASLRLSKSEARELPERSRQQDGPQGLTPPDQPGSSQRVVPAPAEEVSP